VDELVTRLPARFQGVLDISSGNHFAALTLRSLNNERGDCLMTTFPIADSNESAPSQIVFPQIADEGGCKTEFVLLGTGKASVMRLGFFGEHGTPIPVSK